jgi:HEXXH motif-containing protein
MGIEPVPRSLVTCFEAPAFVRAAPHMASGVAAALTRLGGAGPAGSVAALVRSIHCAVASGLGYDFSHSEPTIPFSVFLSNPVGERHAELRLAESLLHEAMHLQLTLIEREAPLVGLATGSRYSPWQERPRPIQGLLHGLYVFTAIYQWVGRLAADPSLPSEERIYADRRLAEIEAEVRAVSALGSAPELTDFGRTLARALLGGFGACGGARVGGSATRRGSPREGSGGRHRARRGDRRKRR